ncbi:MAG: DUF429 domain-containing protein [Thermodesulfobacteriota bacterium]
MIICGLDLSGPSNTAETVLVLFGVDDGGLRLNSLHERVTDSKINEIVHEASTEDTIVIGIDAPLSYNPGGGDRAGDSSLRALIVANGLQPGTVMPPTAPRMVYLTLRGVVVARSLEAICGEAIKIVEVHPSAAMVLRGAVPEQVRMFPKSHESRSQLRQWLSTRGLKGLEFLQDLSEHAVAACACALGAWKWHTDESVWIQKAAPPHHPYDFAC